MKIVVIILLILFLILMFVMWHTILNIRKKAQDDLLKDNKNMLNVKDLVLTIEQAKHLAELGVDMSDAVLCYQVWYSNKSEINIVFYTDELKESENVRGFDLIPTYTLQEVYNKIPKFNYSKLGKLSLTEILTFHSNTGFSYECREPITVINQCHRRPNGILEEYNDNPLDDAYKMLCWSIE